MVAVVGGSEGCEVPPEPGRHDGGGGAPLEMKKMEERRHILWILESGHGRGRRIQRRGSHRDRASRRRRRRQRGKQLVRDSRLRLGTGTWRKKKWKRLSEERRFDLDPPFYI